MVDEELEQVPAAEPVDAGPVVDPEIAAEEFAASAEELPTEPEPPAKTYTAVLDGKVLTWEGLMGALPEGAESGGWPFQFGTAAGMPASMAVELAQWAESRGLDVRLAEESELGVIADGQL